MFCNTAYKIKTAQPRLFNLDVAPSLADPLKRDSSSGSAIIKPSHNLCQYKKSLFNFNFMKLFFASPERHFIILKVGRCNNITI